MQASDKGFVAKESQRAQADINFRTWKEETRTIPRSRRFKSAGYPQSIRAAIAGLKS